MTTVFNMGAQRHSRRRARPGFPFRKRPASVAHLFVWYVTDSACLLLDTNDMIIIYGIGLFGWCEYFELGGRRNAACVAVRCFHVFWIPLFPIATCLVIDPPKDMLACCEEAHGIDIEMCTTLMWQAWGLLGCVA